MTTKVTVTNQGPSDISVCLVPSDKLGVSTEGYVSTFHLKPGETTEQYVYQMQDIRVVEL